MALCKTLHSVTMDVHNLEAEAKAAAVQQVRAMIQRPDQLEKLDVFKKRSERKKNAVAAMLRTGVQSQLEGVRNGISLLHSAAEDTKTIGESLEEVFALLNGFPELKEKLALLRAANLMHSQYAAAMENLKHIFNVPETIEKTHELILEGKLLLAHKHLMDLETARDDLLYELHKMVKQDQGQEYDAKMLKTYFSEVEKLAQELAKQLWYILGRTLEAVRGTDPGPQQVVTVLRIIEREERVDKFYADRKQARSGFLPPGRPRQWRDKAFEVLEKTVQQRIEGNQLEDRTINKQWLARYLEVCRRITVEDLRVAKSGVVPCFPPEYQIYDRFVGFYHSCLSTRLREIASEELHKNELVQLLSWVQAYSGDQMLGNPRLQINVHAMLQDHPLLPKTTVSHLLDQFIQVTRKDIGEWLERSLAHERDDMYKGTRPEKDNFEYYYTGLPAILFQMVESQVQLAKEISVDVIPSVLYVNIEELAKLAHKYRDATTVYKDTHLRDRSVNTAFTAIMIAMANNFDICVDSTDKVKKHVRLTMEAEATVTPRSARLGVNRQELLGKIDDLKEKWAAGCRTAIVCLLDEIFADLNAHLQNIMTRQWAAGDPPSVVNTSTAMETICATVTDYYDDYRHLRPHILCQLLMQLQTRVLAEYIKAIEVRRLTFANADERVKAAEKMKKDGQRAKAMFLQITRQHDIEFTDLTDVLPELSTVLSLQDKSMIRLITVNVCRKYPDVHVDQLTGLLQMREDTPRAEARQIAEESLQTVRFHRQSIPPDPAVTNLFRTAKSDEKKFDFDLTTNVSVFAQLALGTSGISRAKDTA